MNNKNINIDNITSIDELLNYFSFDEIKKAVKEKYSFDIKTYKNNFHDNMKWFFLTPYEAVYKTSKHKYAVISVFYYDPFYLALYNDIEINNIDKEEREDIDEIISKEFPEKLYDHSLYLTLVLNRLISPEMSKYHLLTKQSKSILNFIKEISVIE